jgi:hypothetical protein
MVLSEYPTTIKNTNDLFTVKKEIERVREDLFHKEGEKYSYKLFYTTMKFHIDSGSTDSLKYLDILEDAGKTTPEIFEIDVIQRLLNYKFE